ncbi:MAG TPA: flavin reductase family protein [Sphingomonas sp.]|nr:flavin reductase family protein [Sphingomonas sp.]
MTHPDDTALAEATKLALRRLAKSVVVITCRYEERRYAMAATAVDALSMEPPSLLACVNRSASIHPALAGAEMFAINILRRDHEPLSHHCGGAVKGEARFEMGQWDHDAPVPILADAQAAILCRRDATFEYGTHSIFVGRVAEVRTFGEVDPLVYVDGRYTGLPASAAFTSDPR